MKLIILLLGPALWLSPTVGLPWATSSPRGGITNCYQDPFFISLSLYIYIYTYVFVNALLFILHTRTHVSHILVRICHIACMSAHVYTACVRAACIGTRIARARFSACWYQHQYQYLC